MTEKLNGRWGPYEAELAVACASSEEKPRLYLAHLIAKEVCRAADWSGAEEPGGIDIAKFRALVEGLQ